MICVCTESMWSASTAETISAPTLVPPVSRSSADVYGISAVSS